MGKTITSCKICSSNIGSCDDLTIHLKRDHSLSLKKYITQYDAKYDLFSGEPIEFKSCDQYLSCDFLNRKNYKLWLDGQTIESAGKYLRNKLEYYLSLKSLDTAPSQVECSTIKCLLPIHLIELFSGIQFNQLCEQLGLNTRFRYHKEILINLINSKEIIEEIIIDTREQRPFLFPELKTINAKLDFGDYATNNKHLVCVERKGMNDFLGTLSGGYERFEREIQRCESKGGYLVVVVESTLNNVLYGKRKFGACNGDFIAHKMRSLMRNYKNIQFLFCENREVARLNTIKILSWGDLVRDVDLQYYFDTI